MPYGFEKGQIEELCKDRLVAQYLRRLKEGSTRFEYGKGLCLFFNWLRVVKGLDLGPTEFLNEHRRRLKNDESIEDLQWALSLALEFSRDNPDFAERSWGRKHFLFSIVRSFCANYEADLSRARGVFGKRGPRKYRPRQMSVDMARQVLGCLPQRERAVCLIMLQSGMGIGDVLNKFNFQLDYVHACLRPGVCRIRVDFDERKGNGFSYFTFIGADGLQELRKWFAERDKVCRALETRGIKPACAIFIKSHNGGPYDVDDFEGMYRYYVVKKAKLRTQGPLSLNSHMFRKLFKTESRPPERNVDQDCVEFMMGHLSGIESVGGVYDRTPELYEGVIEKEYAKLEAYVNVYSGRVAQPQSQGLKVTDERLATLELMAKMFEEGKFKTEP